ncbi:Fc.00g074230.m01.CDS01 [Cosmosporella sp. VM-42]
MTFDPLIFTDDYLRVRAVPTCHTSTFVWCHNKGQQGGDWQFMVEPLRKLGHCNHIAFIFPYLDYKESNDRSGISKNEALVQKIVHEEIVKGCDPARIAVGGYNEGLDVALLAILADTNKIGGVLGITDRLALTDAIKELRKTANAKTPVFVVGRSGAKNNAGGKLFTAIGRPVGAVVDGSKNASSSSQPVTQEELEDLDTFIHQTLPVEIAPKN